MNKLQIINYHESGSIGLKICRVAQGAVSIFAKQNKVKLWDVAPGALIISEAGGNITDAQNYDIQICLDYDIMGLAVTNTQDTFVRNAILEAVKNWKSYD